VPARARDVRGRARAGQGPRSRGRGAAQSPLKEEARARRMGFDMRSQRRKNPCEFFSLCCTSFHSLAYSAEGGDPGAAEGGRAGGRPRVRRVQKEGEARRAAGRARDPGKGMRGARCYASDEAGRGISWTARLDEQHEQQSHERRACREEELREAVASEGGGRGARSEERGASGGGRRAARNERWGCAESDGRR
jgi:hypothetical protein